MFAIFLSKIADQILFAVCIFLLGSSVYLTFKTRFVQMRFLPKLLKQLIHSFQKKEREESLHTISPHKALFTAMSTTIGISTIVGPVIAIQIGGPGALLGFLLTAFFGSAATYLEVRLSVEHRKKLANGQIMGGPMQYLAHIFSPKAAKWYALCCTILMTVWSAAQANQLAAILSSPALGKLCISPFYSGVIISTLVLLALMGGIKRIGSLSAKLVPFMFCLYIGSSLWIILINFSDLGKALSLMLESAFSPVALASGTLVGGAVSAFRWGIFKGVQATEAGLGTQTIPHSMAHTQDPEGQGTLAMFSTFSAGGIAFLSGCVALLTNTWQDPSLPLGISMVVASYEQYFSLFGVVIVAISATLFGFGTILGNSFNGSQCYGYLTDNKKRRYYLFATICMIFLGSLGEVKVVWSMIDIVLAFMAVPHMMGLLKSVRMSKEILQKAV